MHFLQTFNFMQHSFITVLLTPFMIYFNIFQNSISSIIIFSIDWFGIIFLDWLFVFLWIRISHLIMWKSYFKSNPNFKPPCINSDTWRQQMDKLETRVRLCIGYNQIFLWRGNQWLMIIIFFTAMAFISWRLIFMV